MNIDISLPELQKELDKFKVQAQKELLDELNSYVNNCMSEDNDLDTPAFSGKEGYEAGMNEIKRFIWQKNEQLAF